MNLLRKLFNNKKSTTQNSGIVKDLSLIIKLITPEDPSKWSGFAVHSYLEKASFYDENFYTYNDMRMIFPLKSLKRTSRYSSFFVWEIDLKEYNKVYNSKEMRFIKNELRECLSLLKENKDDPSFSYLISKYELTLHTILNTLHESREISGYIDDRVKSKSIELLIDFSARVFECNVEKEEKKKRDLKATNDSLLKRLDDEEEYVNKFIKCI